MWAVQSRRWTGWWDGGCWGAAGAERPGWSWWRLPSWPKVQRGGPMPRAAGTPGYVCSSVPRPSLCSETWKKMEHHHWLFTVAVLTSIDFSLLFSSYVERQKENCKIADSFEWIAFIVDLCGVHAAADTVRCVGENQPEGELPEQSWCRRAALHGWGVPGNSGNLKTTHNSSPLTASSAGPAKDITNLAYSKYKYSWYKFCFI